MHRKTSSNQLVQYRVWRTCLHVLASKTSTASSPLYYGMTVMVVPLAKLLPPDGANSRRFAGAVYNFSQNCAGAVYAA
jgi:hypothetical protein